MEVEQQRHVTADQVGHLLRAAGVGDVHHRRADGLDQRAGKAGACDLGHHLLVHHAGRDAGLQHLDAVLPADAVQVQVHRHRTQPVVEHDEPLLSGEPAEHVTLVRVEDLAQRLKSLLEQEEPGLPKDVLLFELATTQEELGKKQDALQSWRKLSEEYPESAYRGEAQQKVNALDPSRSGGLGGGIPGMPGVPGAGKRAQQNKQKAKAKSKGKKKK